MSDLQLYYQLTALPARTFLALQLKKAYFCSIRLKYMENENLLERIEINPKILDGKPVIKGTRLSVQFIIGLLAQGMTMEEILVEYYRLTREDVLACLVFAATALEHSLFYPLPISA